MPGTTSTMCHIMSCSPVICILLLGELLRLNEMKIRVNPVFIGVAITMFQMRFHQRTNGRPYIKYTFLTSSRLKKMRLSHSVSQLSRCKKTKNHTKNTWVVPNYYKKK